MMKDKKWNEKDFAPHQGMDVRRRNRNIENKKSLCKTCEGTGNEFFSMYKKCEKCGGDGIADEIQENEE